MLNVMGPGAVMLDEVLTSAMEPAPVPPLKVSEPMMLVALLEAMMALARLPAPPNRDVPAVVVMLMGPLLEITALVEVTLPPKTLMVVASSLMPCSDLIDAGLFSPDPARSSTLVLPMNFLKILMLPLWASSRLCEFVPALKLSSRTRLAE